MWALRVEAGPEAEDWAAKEVGAPQSPQLFYLLQSCLPLTRGPAEGRGHLFLWGFIIPAASSRGWGGQPRWTKDRPARTWGRRDKQWIPGPAPEEKTKTRHCLNDPDESCSWGSFPESWVRLLCFRSPLTKKMAGWGDVQETVVQETLCVHPSMSRALGHLGKVLFLQQ